MQSEDGFPSKDASRDPEWPARHPALDAALAAKIRAPVADDAFDRQVWARIHADAEAESSAPRAERHRRVGAPLWLRALNAVAIGVVAILVALALGTAAQRAELSAQFAVAALQPSPSSLRVAVATVSGIGLWLGLRWTPWARAIGLSLGLDRVAPRR
jgi:hypothetical protein